MKAEVVTLLSWIGGGIALTVIVTLWLISAHAEQPHKDAVSYEVFDQYIENQREWRKELQADIAEIKRLLNQR